MLTAHPLGARSIVLRMAGLYGPGRIPRQREILAGVPLAVPAESYLNLIHVDDAAAIVLAAERLQSPRIYVVADGQPVVRREYFNHLARLLGAPPPQFQPPPADAAAALRARSDKRVNPARLFRESAIKLMYPSYREGLAAIVAAEANSPSDRDKTA